MACGVTKSQEWMSYYTMPYEIFYVNEEKHIYALENVSWNYWIDTFLTFSGTGRYLV